MRIAVLGTGRIGRMHAQNIAAHPACSLAMVYDVHLASAKDVGASHSVHVARDPDEVFASPDVDAILIASATPTHADFIEASVAAGKAVLCEKPIDLSLERVNAAAQKVRGTNVPIQIGFNRRFDPGHRSAREAAHSGTIGDIHQVVITSRDPEMPPRSYYEVAGGLMRDMTIHDFDLARFMLGEEFVDVFATAGRLIDKPLMDELDDHDTCMIVMTTASGRQCFISNQRQAVYGYDQRVELVGSRGMLVSDNRTQHGLKRYAKGEVEAAAPYQYFFIERYAEAFNAEIDAFVRAVEGGLAPAPDFEDGRRALVLAEAAYRSLAERRVVKVEEIAPDAVTANVAAA